MPEDLPKCWQRCHDIQNATFLLPQNIFSAGSQDCCGQERGMSSRQRWLWQLLGKPLSYLPSLPHTPATKTAVWMWLGHGPVVGECLAIWPPEESPNHPLSLAQEAGLEKNSAQSSLGAPQGHLPTSQPQTSPQNSVARTQPLFTDAKEKHSFGCSKKRVAFIALPGKRGHSVLRPSRLCWTTLPPPDPGRGSEEFQC